MPEFSQCALRTGLRSLKFTRPLNTDLDFPAQFTCVNELPLKSLRIGRTFDVLPPGRMSFGHCGAKRE